MAKKAGPQLTLIVSVQYLRYIPQGCRCGERAWTRNLLRSQSKTIRWQYQVLAWSEVSTVVEVLTQCSRCKGQTLCTTSTQRQYRFARITRTRLRVNGQLTTRKLRGSIEQPIIESWLPVRKTVWGGGCTRVVGCGGNHRDFSVLADDLRRHRSGRGPSVKRAAKSILLLSTSHCIS